MTFVNITALRIPEGAGPEIEKRFAARRRAVDAAEGFEGFELLRPQFGEDRYFVVTRWDTREHYDAWVAVRFAVPDRHGRGSRGNPGQGQQRLCRGVTGHGAGAVRLSGGAVLE